MDYIPLISFSMGSQNFSSMASKKSHAITLTSMFGLFFRHSIFVFSHVCRPIRRRLNLCDVIKMSQPYPFSAIFNASNLPCPLLKFVNNHLPCTGDDAPGSLPSVMLQKIGDRGHEEKFVKPDQPVNCQNRNMIYSEA